MAIRKIYEYNLLNIESYFEIQWSDVRDGFTYRVEEPDGTVVVEHCLSLSDYMLVDNDNFIGGFIAPDAAYCEVNPDEWIDDE